MKTGNFAGVEVRHSYSGNTVSLHFTLDTNEYHGIAIDRNGTTREMLAEYLEDLAASIRKGL